MTYDYTLVNAFTTSPTAGNPAALIILPPSDSSSAVDAQGKVDVDQLTSLYPPLDELVSIAQKLDQPMTAFVVPLPSSHDEASGGRPRYALRWINPVGEVPLCGHATMALSWFLLSSPDFVKNGTDEVEYLTVHHGQVIAGRHRDNAITSAEQVDVALDFPQLTNVKEVSKGSDRYEAIMRTLSTASPTPDWKGDGVLGVVEGERRVLVEVDAEFDLVGLDLDSHKLAGIAPDQLIITQIINPSSPPSSNPAQHAYTDEHVRSRVFNPDPGSEHEDSVTGSAHCLAIPHLLSNPSARRRLDVTGATKFLDRGAIEGVDDVGVKVHQVSPRGGRITVYWRKNEGKVRLVGTCVKVSEGRV